MTDRIRQALEEAHELLTAALRDYDQTKHWIGMARAGHINGTSYDRTGGASGDVNDLSVRVLRPDPGVKMKRRAERAALAVVSGARDWDYLRRQNLTTTSMPALRDEQPCAHCGQEPRYRGDIGRRCYDWRRAHAGALPGPEVLEQWRRGKQPKVRVTG